VTALEVGCGEDLAREHGRVTVVPGERGSQGMVLGGVETVEARRARDLRQPDRGVHSQVVDAGTARRTDQVDVAAEPATGNSALHLPRRGRVRIREHDGLEWCGHDEQADHVLAARWQIDVRSSSPPGN